MDVALYVILPNHIKFVPSASEACAADHFRWCFCRTTISWFIKYDLISCCAGRFVVRACSCLVPELQPLGSAAAVGWAAAEGAAADGAWRAACWRPNHCTTGAASSEKPAGWRRPAVQERKKKRMLLSDGCELLKAHWNVLTLICSYTQQSLRTVVIFWTP